MVSCGITRRFPISLHRLILRATNPRKPLKPACTIPCVTNWPLLFSIIFSFKLLQCSTVRLGRQALWLVLVVSAFVRPANVLDYVALALAVSFLLFIPIDLLLGIKSSGILILFLARVTATYNKLISSFSLFVLYRSLFF
jgi:hypothetical protein